MRRAILTLAALAAAACGPTDFMKADAGAATPAGDLACAGDATRCDGDTFLVCNAGRFEAAATCGACDDDLGCVSCVPGTADCVGDTSYLCREDGSGYDAIFCDPVQGVGCEIDTGRCEGACAPQYLGKSYIGCDYFPTITGNEVNANFEFAVAVANTSTVVATVTVEWGALDAPLTFEVPAGAVQVRTLPWIEDLKGCISYEGVACSGTRRPISTYRPKGAYRLRSTQPVTVYQFNPLDYALPDVGFSYSNDASLLLPANALTGRYVAAAWPSWSTGGSSPSLMAITATQDDTEVTLIARAASEPGPAPSFAPGVPQSVRLHQGDVLELFTFGGDLTGSIVQATRPVQVIAGHFCTFIPQDVGYCDHLEESMFPVEALSRSYVVAAPAVPTLPDGKVQVVRIVATEPDTRLTFDPPQAAATLLAQAGDVAEVLHVTESFRVSADKKILVAQYMEGQEVAGGMGDPAMALVVPEDQYRSTYLFHAPTNYEINYVNVIAPVGAEVVLDGAPLGGFVPIGETGMALRRVVLSAGQGGNHVIQADVPFGISVYGYGQYTSYWYPGGLELETIDIDG